MNKLSFLHCLVLPPLSKMNWVYLIYSIHKVRLSLGYSVPLICVSVFVAMPCCFDYLAFYQQYSLKSGRVMPSALFFLSPYAEVETPILWPPDAKNWLIRKDTYAGQDWRQEEKGTAEDEIVGRHHWFDGQKFEQALGIGEGQGSLAFCSPWGYKESDMTEWLNWTEGCLAILSLLWFCITFRIICSSSVKNVIFW